MLNKNILIYKQILRIDSAAKIKLTGTAGSEDTTCISQTLFLSCAITQILELSVY